MADKKIEVACYEGGKGEESPRSFRLDGEKIDVASITKEWIEEDAADRRRKRFFRIKGGDGFVYTIYCDEVLSQWFLKNV